MNYTLIFQNKKTLTYFFDKKLNTNLIYTIKISTGNLLYNIQIKNFVFVNNQSNILFFNFRILHNILLQINKSFYNLKNGFTIELLLVGLGFKVIRSKLTNRLFFELHFSHNLIYKIPNDILIKCGKKKLLIFGLNKQRVLDIANEIRNLRIPNIYKGKGIRYINEVVKLKPGKQR